MFLLGNVKNRIPAELFSVAPTEQFRHLCGNTPEKEKLDSIATANRFRWLDTKFIWQLAS